MRFILFSEEQFFELVVSAASCNEYIGLDFNLDSSDELDKLDRKSVDLWCRDCAHTLAKEYRDQDPLELTQMISSGIEILFKKSF